MQFILFMVQYVWRLDMKENTNANTQDVPLLTDDQLLEKQKYLSDKKYLTDEEVWELVAKLQRWHVEA